LVFEFLGRQRVEVVLSEAPLSSDAGLLPIREFDRRLGWTAGFAAQLTDNRQASEHALVEMVRQRVFGILAGYEDQNDHDTLRSDPVFKLVAGRAADASDLASQPTLSRFENAVSGWELRDMAHVLADTVIDTHRRRLKGRATRITIDLDPTDDPTHGQQEFSFFNGHYDTWCYLPVVATVTFNDEPSSLPWRRCCGQATRRPRGARGILGRLVGKLRAAFPTAPVRVRLDGGFAQPRLFTFLERQQVEYVVAMASNQRLEKRARRLMGKARMLSKVTGETAHLYGETRYAARTWTRKRRVIIKAEVVRHPGRAPKNNPRFVVTNLPDSPEAVYHFYCGRGDVENRLKELHHGLALDRTSCARFVANQFRVLLTLAAYVLFQELGRRAARTPCADAQVTTLRERLIKLAVWVHRSARRIVLHLPVSFPWLATWRQLARAVGALC
jgi:hypothetical protein